MSECLNCEKKLTYQKFYCSNKCHTDYKSTLYISNWYDGIETGCVGKVKFAVSKTIRRWLIEQENNKCSKCGWGERHPCDGNIALHIDHINGDRKNCRPENLRVLCPNCHSLTPTYGTRNSKT